MSDMNDNSIPFGKTAEQIILEYTKNYDFPICFGFPAGHLSDNRCVRLGINAVLEISKNGVSLSQK
jgi:muramoyltetrapeptide carboxypeptidase